MEHYEQQQGKAMLAGSAAKQSQVSEQLQNVTKSVEAVEAVMHELENRLEPILKQATPSTNKESEKLSEQLVPLASEMRMQKDRLGSIHDHIIDMMRRIEV